MQLVLQGQKERPDLRAYRDRLVSRVQQGLQVLKVKPEKPDHKVRTEAPALPVQLAPQVPLVLLAHKVSRVPQV